MRDWYQHGPNLAQPGRARGRLLFRPRRPASVADAGW